MMTDDELVTIAGGEDGERKHLYPIARQCSDAELSEFYTDSLSSLA